MRRLRSSWQYILKHWIVAITIALVITAMVLILVESLINGTGFNGYNQVTIARTISGPSAGTVVRTEVSQTGKTLWDWMQLLFIPVVLAIAGFWFNHRERKAAELRAENEQEATEKRTRDQRMVAELRAEDQRAIEQQRAKVEQDIASDNQREAALQAYIDKISELLMHEELDNPTKKLQSIARSRTLVTLSRLDGARKANLLLFLYDTDLLLKKGRYIDLEGADLSGVDLHDFKMRGVNLGGYAFGLEAGRFERVNLTNANLSGADLSHSNLMVADLSEANMKEVDLSEAYLNECDLHKAKLNGAILIGTDLSATNLSEADLRNAHLRKANLSGADLSEANLSGADLREAALIMLILTDLPPFEANLQGADLSGVDLSGASVTHEQLEKVKSLKGATMPDGSIHD